VGPRLADDRPVAAARGDHDLVSLDAAHPEKHVRDPSRVERAEDIQRTARAEPAQRPRLAGAACVDAHHQTTGVHGAERVARRHRHRARKDRHLHHGRRVERFSLLQHDARHQAQAHR
jgi:hypothetical protein